MSILTSGLQRGSRRMSLEFLTPAYVNDLIISDWSSRITANSGSVSVGVLNAADTFITTCKNSGVWDKLQRLNLFAGDQLAACLTPIINTYGGAKDINTNFIEADYSQTGGLNSDGVTKRLNTNFIPNSSIGATSCHLSTYIITGAVGTSITMGCTTYGVNNIQFRIGTNYNDAAAKSFAIIGDYNYGANPQFQMYNTSGITQGFIVVTKPSVNEMYMSKSGITYLSNTSTYVGLTTLPTQPVYIFVNNDNGYPGQYTDATMGSYSVGSGLSVTQVSGYSFAMQNFQKALSR